MIMRATCTSNRFRPSKESHRRRVYRETEIANGVNYGETTWDGGFDDKRYVIAEAMGL